MMRVCYLASTMDNMGGAERVNYQVLTRLPRDQFETQAIFVKQPGKIGEQLAQSGVVVYTIGSQRQAQFLATLKRVWQQWKRSPVEIVFTGEDRISMAIAALGRRCGIIPRYVLCFHNTRAPWGVGKLIHPFSVRAADAYVLLSSRNLSFWRQHYPMPDNKVYIIPNGIPLESVKLLNCSARQQHRYTKGLAPDKYTVGLVTFFKEFKNLPAFIEVARKVVDTGISAQFVLVGDGPDRVRVEQAIENLQMRSYCILPGPAANAYEWYPLFDVALMTSVSSEAFPLTLIEAMACGLPVVATDIAGIPDIVVHGETGFIAAPSEIDKLAQYVVQLARDPELRQRMGEAGRRRARAEFDVNVMVERYATMFLNVVHRS